MKKIPLSIQGKNRGSFAIVDDADFVTLSRFRWAKNGKRKYAMKMDMKSHKMVSMHRQIMNPQNKMQVDHINGNGLDNRRSNLRLCTHSQNLYNHGGRKVTESGFKGVSRMRDRWVARFTIERKLVRVGIFDTPIEAAIAYNKMVKKYHGEFAWLNPIPRKKKTVKK